MIDRKSTTRRILNLSLALTLFGVGELATQPASGQRNEAIPGRPFGVARVTVPIGADDRDVALLDAFRIADPEGRVLYPTFSDGSNSGILDELVGGGPRVARSLTVHFLFKGDAPFSVSVFTGREHVIRITPRPARPIAERRVWRTWWREYNAAASRQTDEGDYPPLIQTYLTSMLGRRLGLETPLLQRTQQASSSELQQTLELLFGIESYRLGVMRRTSLGQEAFEAPLVHALPPNPEVSPRAFVGSEEAETIDDGSIEPIARHVPAECFYIRFGTWDNQVWLNGLLAEYGGDLSRMVSLRGQDNQATAKMLEQLALEQTAVTELLGGQLIADVAVIGRDTFMNEGSATAVILEGKNGLLGGALGQQRRLTAGKLQAAGATLETIDIDGHEVSFLSTPDNTVRSFFASDGNYHITSNSREIVRRFFEAGAGKASLADTLEFRYARQLMPLEREDTIFIYFSNQFLRGLISPQYQVELARRIRSVTDLELVQLARLAARAEGLPSDTIEDLVAGGLLPRGFGRRPDGGGPIIEKDRTIDSMRGARGYFTPVPDVEIAGVTEQEMRFYRERAAYYEQNWEQFDPLMIGLKRLPVDDTFERLVIDAKISPFGEEKYGWLFSLLGDPLPYRMASTPDDIIHVEASLRGGTLLPSVPNHTVFAAVQDDRPPATDLQPTGFFKILEILKTTPGYLGAWPKPGYLDLLPFLGAQPDPEGFTRSLLGVWRWQGGGYSILSFDRDRLAAQTHTLGQIEEENLAHIRLYVGDLSESTLRYWVNSMAFSRARQTSLGNSRMLHSMTQQLRVPSAEAKAVTESILNVGLVCALGGEYAPVAGGPLDGFWLSNAVGAPTGVKLPAEFEAPVLNWFRGLEASMLKTERQVQLHLELDIAR